MFSGIIEATGRVVSFDSRSKGASLVLRASGLSRKVKSGDSIAVNGVCLTVTKKQGENLSFDVSMETLNKTNLSSFQQGSFANLELPVTAETMLSGHFVQGHVEGVGQVKDWIRNGEDIRLFVNLPADLLPYCVPKGSIALNGVSLTIASQKGRTIGVALIPYTLKHTNLDALKRGDPVNIETDIIGRYVVSALKKTYDSSRTAARPSPGAVSTIQGGPHSKE
jgi:riboflavin synthase